MSFTSVSLVRNVTSISVTAKNDLFDRSPRYPSHIAASQCFALLLLLLFLSFYATCIPPSFDSISGAHNAISMFNSIPDLLQLWMRRIQASCITLGSSQPPQSGYSGSRDSQGGQKRKSNSSDGSNHGKKAKRTGNDGSNASNPPRGDKAEEEDEKPKKEGKKPKKVKTWKEKLFNDDNEPYGCPYFWRRPDMWAVCRGFRRSGAEIHRLKEHLYKHHRCYLCNKCLQSFEHKIEFTEHNKAKPCLAGGPRDFLLGFDDFQMEQLDPHTEGSPLKGALAPNIKWKTIYSILFPDVEWSGIPNPLENPDTRDVLRWTREDCINSLKMPFDFDEWRKNQSSTNLILDTPDLDDQFFSWAFEPQDTNPTSHSSPAKFDGITSSGRTEGHEYLCEVGSGNVRRIPSHHMKPVPQFGTVPSSLLSPPRRLQASSSEMDSNEPPSQTWGSSITYRSGSQVPSAIVQAAPACRPPDAGHDKPEIYDSQITASSAHEDRTEIGGQFLDPMLLTISDASQSNTYPLPR